MVVLSEHKEKIVHKKIIKANIWIHKMEQKPDDAAHAHHYAKKLRHELAVIKRNTK